MNFIKKHISKLIVLLLLNNNCYSQEAIVGYRDTYGNWQLIYDFVNLTNMILINDSINDIHFDSQEFLNVGDTDITIQLHGVYEGYTATDRVVLAISDNNLITAPSGASHTTCVVSNSCCLYCKKDFRGNCYCYAPVCEGGCTSRTYAEPIDISNTVRNYLIP